MGLCGCQWPVDAPLTRLKPTPYSRATSTDLVIIVKLDQWIRKHKVSPGDLADELRVTRMALWRYRKDGRIPSPEIMRRLVRRTQGQVTPNDFHEVR